MQKKHDAWLSGTVIIDSSGWLAGLRQIAECTECDLSAIFDPFQAFVSAIN